MSSLPLSSGWLAKLVSCGFERVDDLKDVGVVELSKGRNCKTLYVYHAILQSLLL